MLNQQLELMKEYLRKNNIKKAKKTAEEIFLLLDELNNA